MFQSKVCGVTTEEDARHAAAAAGCDAIGLNFYAKSPRSIAPEDAPRLAAAAAGATVVGVFVNASAEEINGLAAAAPLDAVQLHGDEPVELLLDLTPGVPVIRAFRMGEAGLAPLAEQLAAARRLGRPFAAALVDAPGSPGEYGGTGRTADWERIAAEKGLLGDTPLILAGGLTPANVAEAILATGADGVDTASGVESSPGVKDPHAVAAFVAAARQVFVNRPG